MKMLRLLILLMCGFALPFSVMAEFDKRIDGVEVDFPLLANLPGTPSDNVEEYAEALTIWMNSIGISNFDKNTALYLVQIRSSQRDKLIWQVMRDILFLQTVKDSISHWEEEYIQNPIPEISEWKTAEKPESFFKNTYGFAEKIHEQYLEYQSKVDHNVLISTALIGADISQYSSMNFQNQGDLGFIKAFMESKANAITKATLKSVVFPKGSVDQIMDTLAFNVLDAAKITKFELTEFTVNRTFSYLEKSTVGTANTVVQLAHIASNATFAIVGGGLGASLAPAHVSYELIEFAIKGANNTSMGMHIVNYFWLLRHHPELFRGAFNEQDSILNLGEDYTTYYNLKCENNLCGKDKVLYALTRSRTYMPTGLNATPATISNEKAIGAYSIADTFLLVDAIDIDSMKKNLAAFAYANYLVRQQKAVFVVDTTGSMSPEISAVKTAISNHVGNLTDSSQRFGLITFKDDEVSHFFNSSTVNTVEILEASGGKDCEELSNEALLKAYEPSSAFGRVVLITDASAKDYDKGAKVVKKAKEAFVAIDAIITGDCYLNVETPSKLKKRLTSKSGRVQYQAISEQTGGISFDIGKTEVDKIFPISIGINGPNRADILRYGIRLKNGETIKSTRRKRDSKTRQSVEIPIDNTLSETVTFMLTGSSANALPVFTLTRPDGRVVQSTDSDMTYLQLSSVMSYTVEKPITGKWQASFEGKGEFLLSVFGDSVLRLEEITLLSQMEESSSPSPDALSPIVGELVGGSEIVVAVRFTAAPQTVSLSLLKLADESVISIPTVTAVDGEGSRYFQATITVPTEPFKLSFKGLTAEGSEFVRVMPVPFTPQSVKITATPPFAEAMPQTTATFEMTVSNLSNAEATYTITASNTREWLVTLPATITVESGSSKTVTVNVDIPADAVTDTINEVTIAVEDTNDPTIGNNTRVWLKVAENQIVTPASCQAYAVNDKGRNDSQFFTIDPETSEINELGPMYKGHDIESLAIHPITNAIYAASGDNVTNGKKGYFYIVDGQTGELFPVGYTGFNEIEDLAFSLDGTLWAWAKGKDGGMITIDLTTGVGKLKIPSDIPVEGLTLSKETNRTVFYGSVNTELWVYDMDAETLEVACNNLLGETEALEMMSDGLLLMGIDKDKSFSLHAFDAKACQVVIEANMPTNQFDDVEGIALPIDACAN